MAGPFYYESVTIAGVANTETLEDILTSTEEEAKHIDAIAFFETTAVENHDAELAMYIERERIVSVPMAQNQRSHDSDVRLNTDPFFPIGHDLPVGQAFKVGHVSGAVASDMCYTVRYTIP
jgi:hypothetical protein